jgi:hypothetical protein
MQIEPQNPLPLVYLITDHTDESTYYVRAVGRDSLTGEILFTVSLTDRGNRRFTNTVNAPVDGTGLGRHIDVTITPYTDSGYTQKAAGYQEHVDRWYIRAMRTGGGGGGVEIDYPYLLKRIKKIAEDAADRIDIPESDFSEVLVAVRIVQKAVDAIEFPEIPVPEKIDLQPVLDAVRAAKDETVEAVDGIDIPEAEKINLSPVIEALRATEGALRAVVESSSGTYARETARAAGDAIREELATNDKKNAAVRKAMAQFFGNVDLSEPPEEKPTKKHRYFS